MSPIYIPLAIKKAVIERASNYCEYCQSPDLYSPEIFEIEHIQPLSGGGTSTLANLALSCPACNRYKGTHQTAIDPETGLSTKLFNPRLNHWQEHFTWDADFCVIVGLTSVGRCTIVTLNMNRSAVQRFRLALVAIEQHPSQNFLNF